MKEFVLAFYGLKPGIHTYNFEIGKTFFSAFENSLIENADFHVTLSLDKQPTMLTLSFSGKGEIRDFCDRCGDPLTMKSEVSDEIIVKFGDEDYEQTDEILVLSRDTHDVDIAPMIYEMIALHLPSKRVHKNRSACNAEVLAKLSEKESRNEQNETDPRWEALKKLK